MPDRRDGGASAHDSLGIQLDWGSRGHRGRAAFLFGHCCVAALEEASVILLEIRRLKKMLKGAEPWVYFVDATLAGDLVQVDPAAGAEATAIGPAQRLKWKVQEHVFT